MTRKSKYSVIFSALAIAGVGLTGFLSAKCKPKYDENIYDMAKEKWDVMDDEEFEERKNDEFFSVLDKKDYILIGAKSYSPAIGSGAATILSIIFAEKINLSEIAMLGTALAGIKLKYKDAMNFLKREYPEQYKQVKKFVDIEEAKRAIKKDKKIVEETYDGRKRYYFPYSKQVVYMKPEDFVDVQRFIDGKMSLGADSSVSLNEILDYINQDLKYKDVHLSRIDYIWNFDGMDVLTEDSLPHVDVTEYDDVDLDGETITCRIAKITPTPSKDIVDFW